MQALNKETFGCKLLFGKHLGARPGPKCILSRGNQGKGGRGLMKG